MQGEEGIGKSTLLLSVGAALASGKGIRTTSNFEFVDIPAGNILLLSAEESLSHVLKPRLLALGAPLEKFMAIDEPFSFDQDGLLRLKMAISEHEPRLVIIDPLFSYAGKINLNNDNEVRSITRELSTIAHTFGCTVAGVRHIGKSKGLGSARSSGLNGVGWGASARSAMLIGRDQTTGETAITQFKTNISRSDSRSWGFEIVAKTITNEDGDPVETSTLRWKGESTLTIHTMLATSFDAEKVAEESDAVLFLREALFEGERPSNEVRAEARLLGISDKQLRTARMKLGIKAGNGTIRKEG